MFLAVAGGPGVAPNLPVELPRDFAAIGFVLQQPIFIAVSPKAGINSIAELIARAKDKPDEISYASTGRGRLTHLTMELLQDRAQVKLRLVPYAGGPAQAMPDIMSGRVDLVLDAYAGLAGATQGGLAKMLADTADKRLPGFENLPTIAETLPGFFVGAWAVMVAPTGTPDAIIRKANADLRVALADKDLLAKFAANGAFTQYMTPEETVAFTQSQQKTWRPILERIAREMEIMSSLKRMPIHEPDPWRVQYFEHAVCPPDVDIPTEDADSWRWYPEHRWVYDKIAVALSQGLDAGPHGVMPPRFPVFSKPITNLKGMGAGSRVCARPPTTTKGSTPGHMWMTLLEGQHVSSDVAIVDGEPAGGAMSPASRAPKARSTIGPCAPAREAGARGLLRRVDREASAWLHRHDQHRDDRRAHDRGAPAHERPVARPLRRRLGRGGGAALSRAALGIRRPRPARRLQRRPVRAARPALSPSARRLVEHVRRMPGVSSVQITFHEDKAARAARHAAGRLPARDRQCWDLDAGRAGRELMRAHFLAAGRVIRPASATRVDARRRIQYEPAGPRHSTPWPIWSEHHENRGF